MYERKQNNQNAYIVPDVHGKERTIQMHIVILNYLSWLFRGKDSVRHFPVTGSAKEMAFGMAKFSTVRDLLKHFSERPLVAGETGTVTVTLLSLLHYLLWIIYIFIMYHRFILYYATCFNKVKEREAIRK